MNDFEYELKTGLDKSITYTILNVKKIQENNIDLFKIRDPRGKEGSMWTGDWGNDSKKWTPELKKRVDWS